MSEQIDYKKIVVCGDGGVGKTTLLHRLIHGEFLDHRMTIGVGFHTYEMDLNSKKVICQIWDLGGQEQFRQMGVFERYLLGTHGILLAFDRTSKECFSELPVWIKFLRENNNQKAPIVLIGTKSDLTELIEVKNSEAKQFASQNKLIGFIHTSSKDNTNVSTPLSMLLEKNTEIE